ncbi:MAG TPA: DUF5103 domain-containing protein, partial [Bacteroidetes bacterium]|nr:DUF5103 domain-containing protein [Bacteroidota bacterium]
LLPIEYVDGYGEERIQNFDYSFKAKSIYTHYWFSLPNEDMSFSKSGNYLLKVYEEEEEKRLVITRRFVVVERQIQIFARPARVAAVHLDNTHQEVDFTVKHEGFEIRNPRQELFATVLQNGRWDTAIAGIPPFISGGTEQRFDYQGKIVFPAGKEFRYVDLRGLKYKDPRLTEVTIDHDGYEARIEMDRKRGGGAHFEWRDINGNFIIENTDESGRIAFSRDSSDAFGFTSTGAKSFVNNLESEYVDVLFTLYSPGEMYGEDLYIFGGLSDWELKPEFKMVYNPAIYAYVGKVKLKQGYYDYIYAAVSHETGKADFEVTEGNAYETENEYTILVYYREFGSRYDRLIGIETISSRY